MGDGGWWVVNKKGTGCLMNEAKIGVIECANKVEFFVKPRKNERKKSGKQNPWQAQKLA